MSSKKKIIMSACTFGIIAIIATILFLNMQKYSISDIDADNYHQKLKQSGNNLNEVNFSKCIPDNFELDLAIHREEGENEYGKISRTKSEFGIDYVDYTSKTSGLSYRTGWKNGIFITCHIGANISSNPEYFSNVLKRILDKLILTQGFVLKESKLKNGFDILIKETDSDFVIFDIIMSYSEGPIYSILVSTYGRKKYFR